MNGEPIGEFHTSLPRIPRKVDAVPIGMLVLAILNAAFTSTMIAAGQPLGFVFLNAAASSFLFIVALRVEAIHREMLALEAMQRGVAGAVKAMNEAMDDQGGEP